MGKVVVANLDDIVQSAVDNSVDVASVQTAADTAISAVVGLDTVVAGKVVELDNYTTVKEGELDSHTIVKEGDIDTYVTGKEPVIDAYVDSKGADVIATIQTAEDEVAAALVSVEGVRAAAIAGANTTEANKLSAQAAQDQANIANTESGASAVLSEFYADKARLEGVSQLTNLDVTGYQVAHDVAASADYTYNVTNGTSVLDIFIPKNSFDYMPEMEFSIDANGNLFSEVIGESPVAGSVQVEWSTGEVLA